MPRVEEIIAENRRRIRQTDARAIEVGDIGRKDLSFSRNTIRVDVSLSLYSRDLGAGLFSGHPDPSHGSGRGEGGDTRGEWTLLTETTTSDMFTREGSNVVRDVLDGQSVSVTHAGIGTGTTDATRADTALVAESARRGTWGTRTGNATTTHAIFRFSDHAATVDEVGVFDATGRLLARATVPSQSLTVEDELRADVTLTVTGDAPGSAVITNAGEEAVAESLRSPASDAGLNEFAFGTGTGTYSKTSTGLFTESFRKFAARNLSTATLSAFSVVYAFEPSTQPLTLSEVGVFDAAGRLVWATTFEPFEKTDEFPFSATVGFKIE